MEIFERRRQRRLSEQSEKILAAFNGDPSRMMYGLEISKAAGLKRGTIYPALAMLERRDLIRGGWESPDVAIREKRRQRRYYVLAP